MNGVLELLEDFSLEMTGKDVGELQRAAAHIPRGTQVNVTYLSSEDVEMRVDAARAVKESGHIPVPHIAARRVRGKSELASILSSLESYGLQSHLFVVGGDPRSPMGPFPDSLSVINSGLLKTHGVEAVGIAGFPEGHPDISDAQLADAISSKVEAVAGQHLDGSVITQFGFDIQPVLAWLERIRSSGIHLPVRVGVPGPSGIRRLLRYAARFGVNSSSAIVRKYGFSVANLLGTAGPGTFISEFARSYDPTTHGVVKFHFYTFGGIVSTAEWIRDFKEKNA